MLEKLLKNSFYYWFLLILTAILSYGFALTHSSMGVDDEILDNIGISFTKLSIIEYK